MPTDAAYLHWHRQTWDVAAWIVLAICFAIDAAFLGLSLWTIWSFPWMSRVL